MSLSCRLQILLAIILALTATLVQAYCECGYQTPSTSTSPSYTYTDLLESDFLHIANISLDTDWVRQEYNVSATAARGTYGQAAMAKQVVANPMKDKYSYAGASMLGGDAGLQMWVNGGIPEDGLVSMAEVDSWREDMLWGSYRASIKVTPTPGTCSAFYWYFNNSQEIDIEFLSADFSTDNNSFPVNLVLQSEASVQAGYNAANSGTFATPNLPFNPTTGFHEYRFDFQPGQVTFFADGQVLATMNSSAVPTSAGHISLSQWSNGNSQWSSGPPAENSVTTISYVKAYFNSSLPSRQAAYASRCRHAAAAPSAICTIPDQLVPPNPDAPNGNATANTWFFSNQPNMTPNQTVYRQESMGTGNVSTYLFLAMLTVGTLLFGLG